MIEASRGIDCRQRLLDRLNCIPQELGLSKKNQAMASEMIT